MLKRRLFSFLSSLQKNHNLSDLQQSTLYRAILLYVLGRRSANDFRVLGRDLGITEELYQFKSEFLDRSYYIISQFWRVAFNYFKALEVPTADGPGTTEIDRKLVRSVIKQIPTILGKAERWCREDMELIEDLPLSDHRHLYRLSRAVRFETPTDFDLFPIVKQLQRFCKGLAYNKMRFVIKNDASISFDDLANELFEAALITLRHCDIEFSNTEKVLNCAKRGAQNHCVNLLDFHTAQCRSRIVPVTMPDNSIEFVTTTMSLDHKFLQEDKTSGNLLDVVEDNSYRQDLSIEEREWFDYLFQHIPNSMRRVAAVVLGETDPEFESWVISTTSKTVDDFSDAALTRMACKFFDVSIHDIRKTVGRVTRRACA